MHEVSAADAPTFASKTELYDWLTKQAVVLVENMSSKLTPQANLTIGLANIAALYFYELNRFADPAATLQDGLPVNWFGFYLLQGAGVMALGPFQGRPACTQIRVGRGVCGRAAETGTTMVVTDVHAFADHIACDAASQSEVVVPIKVQAAVAAAAQDDGTPAQAGAAVGSAVVVGGIDVDSTQLAHFDDADAAGLERLAEVLVAHLHFPSARALLANPTLATAQPSYAALTQRWHTDAHGNAPAQSADANAGATAPASATEAPADAAAAAVTPATTAEVTKAATTTTTTATTALRVTPGIAFAKIEALQPDTTTKTVAGWSFTITRLDRIVAAQELAALEADLGIGAFPEIQFPHNTLRIARDAAGVRCEVLSFDLHAVLRNARAFYTTAQYTRDVAPQLVIPVSDSWANSQYARFDPKVDWAWRNNYFGLPDVVKKNNNSNNGSSNTDGSDAPHAHRDAALQLPLLPLPPGMPGINWSLLSDRQLPILLYDAFDLFEDDLHDSGLVRCSVKFRAMPTAFYVLFRHLVRVDGHETWLREVRCYHEFTAGDRDTRVHDAAAPLRIVFNEQMRKLSHRNTDDVSWRNITDDALSQRATLLQSSDYYIDVPTTTTTTATTTSQPQKAQ